MRMFSFALASLVLGLAAALPPAVAQTLDTPIRIIVGYAPGGASDRVARIVGDRLQAQLGVPVVVENKTGAGGRIAAQQVKGAAADQNLMFVGNPAVLVVAPLVFKDLGYDVKRDFVPVAQVSDYEFALAVAPTVPANNLSELIDWLRAHPGESNFGVPATGSLPHFFGLMMAGQADVPGQIVGYRGSAPLINDLLGGQVPVAFDTLDTLLPQHEAGKLRILAVSGAKRSPFAPAVPTFREAGLDLVATGWNAFFASSSMPKDRLELIANATRDVMQDPDTQRRFLDARMTPIVSSHAQTAAMFEAYQAQWAPVVKKSGYQP